MLVGEVGGLGYIDGEKILEKLLETLLIKEYIVFHVKEMAKVEVNMN